MRPTRSKKPSGGSYRGRTNNDSNGSVATAGDGPRRRDWFPSAGEMVTLVADAAQKGNEVLAEIEEKKARIVFSNLQIGDFQITDNVYVTYMTSEEFVRRLADKRIYRQVLELKRTCPEPVLIIEGISVYEVEGANANVINGALAFISILNRIPVVFTSDAAESADVMFMATNQMQFGLGFEVHTEDQRMKKRELKEVQLDVLGALPGVGPQMAKALLKKHGTLQGVFSADADALGTTTGVDGPTGEALTKLFEAKG
jgi:ERCC4-type nuclease